MMMMMMMIKGGRRQMLSRLAFGGGPEVSLAAIRGLDRGLLIITIRRIICS
jgi:hypothetical protein